MFYFSPSLKNQLRYPRKSYFIDNGFISSLSTKFSKDFGRLFENFVFWQLYRKYQEDIFYHQDRFGKEVDFVIFKNNRPDILLQASWDITDFETRQREEKALLALGKSLNCEKLFIVTKEEVSARGAKIKILGVNEFLDF